MVDVINLLFADIAINAESSWPASALDGNPIPERHRLCDLLRGIASSGIRAQKVSSEKCPSRWRNAVRGCHVAVPADARALTTRRRR